MCGFKKGTLTIASVLSDDVAHLNAAIGCLPAVLAPGAASSCLAAAALEGAIDLGESGQEESEQEWRKEDAQHLQEDEGHFSRVEETCDPHGGECDMRRVTPMEIVIWRGVTRMRVRLNKGLRLAFTKGSVSLTHPEHRVEEVGVDVTPGIKRQRRGVDDMEG